jgi:hypothetical protein
VVLVNREPDFTLAASYLWVMTGARRPEQLTRPLKRLERRGTEVVVGDVTDIDPTTRTLTVGGQRLTGDHLAVSLGADWATDRVPGLAEHGHTYAGLAAAQRLARELERIKTRRSILDDTRLESRSSCGHGCVAPMRPVILRPAGYPEAYPPCVIWRHSPACYAAEDVGRVDTFEVH